LYIYTVLTYADLTRIYSGSTKQMKDSQY